MSYAQQMVDTHPARAVASAELAACIKAFFELCPGVYRLRGRLPGGAIAGGPGAVHTPQRVLR